MDPTDPTTSRQRRVARYRQLAAAYAPLTPEDLDNPRESRPRQGPSSVAHKTATDRQRGTARLISICPSPGRQGGGSVRPSSPGEGSSRLPICDGDALLASVDLPSLADDLAGPPLPDGGRWLAVSH